MKYEIKHFLPGIHVQWTFNQTLWATRNHHSLLSVDGGKNWTRIFTIPTQPVRRISARIPFLRRLFRLGVRSYLQLTDRDFIVFCDRAIFLASQNNTPALIGEVRHGTGPLSEGCCVDDKGNGYYGEYWQNPQHDSVAVHIWKRGGSRWEPFYIFPPGAIRHIHAVQFDLFSKKIWIATGDEDKECHIGYFDDSSGLELRTVAAGCQNARAVSLLFTEDYIYWGSDGGRGTTVKANHIYRYCRHTGNIEQVAEVGGPVYYSTMDQAGRMFVCTVVEGAASEPDRCAHLWMSTDGINWNEVWRCSKDRYPFIFGYGVLSFPKGFAPDSRLYVVAHGVKGGHGTWILEPSRASH
jgi:hypothetical protein